MKRVICIDWSKKPPKKLSSVLGSTNQVLPHQSSYCLGGTFRDTRALVVATAAAASLGLMRDLERHSRQRLLPLRRLWSCWDSGQLFGPHARGASTWEQMSCLSWLWVLGQGFSMIQHISVPTAPHYNPSFVSKANFSLYLTQGRSYTLRKRHATILRTL